MKCILVLLILSIFFTAVHSQVNVSINVDNPPCFSNCDGVATANAFGGTPPFTYNWSTGSTAQTVTGLCVGQYSVTVTDNLGTTGSLIWYPIGSPGPIQLDIATTNQCAGTQNGSVSVNVISGGTWPFTYIWSVPNSGPVLSNVPAGGYSVTVSDGNNCSVSQPLFIYYIANPVSSITIDTDPALCQLSNGSASVTSATGGTTPYTYLWQNMATSQSTSGLSAGNYLVTVTDANGCSITQNFSITDSIGFLISLDSLAPANCINNQMGHMEISTSGGQGPFGVTWAPGGMTTFAISNLNPGLYMATIIDSTSGCVLTYSNNITYNSNIYVSVSKTEAFLGDNGTATVTVYGGSPPYSYIWDDYLSQTDSVANYLFSSTYHVTITDAIGCTVIAEATVGGDPVHAAILGRIHLTNDLNCTADTDEVGLPGIIVHSSMGTYTSTDINGNYLIYGDQDPTFITMENTNNYYVSACPPNFMQMVHDPFWMGPYYFVDIGVLNNNGMFELAVFPSGSTGRPGFTQSYFPYVKFFGDDSLDVTLIFHYDPVLIYDSCLSGGAHDIINHTITWNFPNYHSSQPNTWSYISPIAYFTVPSSVPIGTILNTYSEVLPSAGDYNPINNFFYYSDVVVGGFDPNYIHVDPAGTGANGCIQPEDSVLLYNIHFQNTGTDTAFTVIVVDTLPGHVNPATFELGVSSHPCTFTMNGSGIVSFKFDQILLPDSGKDMEGSQGFVNFTVHTDPGLAWNTFIENSAAIYFDFNAPVITNTVINTLCEPVTLPTVNNLSVSVYPNPAKNAATFTVSGNEKEWSIKIIDVCGKEILVKEISARFSYETALPESMSGLYFYEISSGSKKAFGKLVVE